MVTISLYKIGAVFAGIVVVSIIDQFLGIKYPDSGWINWRQIAHKAIYMSLGAIIVAL